ncbi:MAG TPA: GntR family transcriptional regulator [Caldilineae bacterium]|nr:GntR family transcriptional regulator [Caldilineae bacterium]
MNLEYKPGENITDRQVAQELNISRTPVREALRLLEHEGLIVSQPRRGWRVYTLSLKDIEEIFDIKIVLESAIARWAATCEDAEKKSALKEALARMKRAVAENDREAWVEADLALHDVIFSMCGNQRAVRVVKNMNDQWWRVRIGLIAMEGRMARSTREHEVIVSAIVAGDPDAAERQMRTHLESLRRELIHVLTNLVLPFAHHGM